MLKTNYDTRTIKKVINNNFTFADLSPRFKNVDSSTGNIFCPFHENHDTPAAKMYWDDERGIWIIHCFSEHINFTAYDYVDKILCEKYNKYVSPIDFLKANMPDYKLGMQLDLYQKQIEESLETITEVKKNYIDTVFDETGNVEDFIERLYTA